MNQIERMKERILDIINPDIDYTQEDFDKEFSNFSYTNDSFKMNINFVNKSNNKNPKYETSGSAGFDLRADLKIEVTISAKGGIAIIPTGLYFELPSNFEMQIRPRSGLAAKNGITVLNSPGTIDSDYRGEIKVILINHGHEDFKVNNGDRIAQGVIASVVNENIFNFNQVNEISDNTERSSGGFGSTGTK
jgi:dUTP pyrophosphatase